MDLLFSCGKKGGKVGEKMLRRLRVYWLIQNSPMSPLWFKHIFSRTLKQVVLWTKTIMNSGLLCIAALYPLVCSPQFYYIVPIAQIPIRPSDGPSACICIFNLYLLQLCCPIAPVSSSSWQWRRRHEQASSEWCTGWSASQDSWDGWLTAGQLSKSMLSSFWRRPGSGTLIWVFLLGQASDFAEVVGFLLSSRAQFL